MKINSSNINAFYSGNNTSNVNDKKNISSANDVKGNTKVPVQERVELSNLDSDESFDASKVAALRQKISEGRFTIDPESIAKKMIDTFV